jgi:hypothetical protein
MNRRLESTLQEITKVSQITYVREAKSETAGGEGMLLTNLLQEIRCIHVWSSENSHLQPQEGILKKPNR